MSTDINFLINENIYDLEDFTCIICQCLINNAVGIKCDIDIHIFCENCIKKWFEKNDYCPICMKFQMNKSDLVPITLIRNIINGLKRYCDNKKDGCSWIDSLEKYQDHIKRCEYRTIACEYKKFGCQDTFKLKEKNN